MNGTTREPPRPLELPQARELAERLLRDLNRRWAHVQGVASRARDLSRDLTSTQADVVEVAAWLHDIGYSPQLQDTGFHPLDGARYLRAAGADPIVVQLVAHHTGASFEAAERSLTAELAEFDRPPPLLLDTLTAADVLTGPSGLPVSPEDRVTEILTRYRPDDPVHRAVSQSGPELIAAARRALGRLDQPSYRPTE